MNQITEAFTARKDVDEVERCFCPHCGGVIEPSAVVRNIWVNGSYCVVVHDACIQRFLICFESRIASAAATLGSLTSEAKKKSSAANGAKGGRPRKNAAQ